MFEAVELATKEINTEYGFTVRIGMAPTQARFYLTDQNQMLWLLNTLTSINIINIATQSKSYDFNTINTMNTAINGINNNNQQQQPQPQQQVFNSNNTIRRRGGFNNGLRSHSYSKGLSSMKMVTKNNLNFLRKQRQMYLNQSNNRNNAKTEEIQPLP